MALGSGGTLNFNAVGLHIDNTSGGPVTLSTNSPETWQNGGFTFNGSNNLNLGNGADHTERHRFDRSSRQHADPNRPLHKQQ